MDTKGAGLKLPVLINIQEMPPKLTFKFSPTSQTEQSLLGNRHRVDVFISKKQNVNLKTLKLQFDEISANEPDDNLRSVELGGFLGMNADNAALPQSTDMNASTTTQDTGRPNAPPGRRYTNVEGYSGQPRRS